MTDLKRSEMQRLDAEHEVTRLKAALDRQLAESREMQVHVLSCFVLGPITKHIL